VLLILGEALSSACVLGLAAELEQFLGDNRVRELSVRSFPSQPVLGGWTLAATWGACSLPLSVNFIGVVFILYAVRWEFGPFMLLAVLAALFIAGSGLVQMYHMLFFPEATAKPDLSLDRPAPPTVTTKTDLTLLESVPYAFLLLLNAAAGCFPSMVIWLLYWGHWQAR
jgi:NADH:ubiquinone oxidoreductase subunit 4 (subunit M)